ncbi:MAG: HlyD family efflux transporter periplasmic adaptor subunit [Hyphomicrobiaceae bacterium]|nr:HlyD family efflux transporter periplasmic adaptor subunit [Hyphomicrobiaceae bacterium]
MKLLYNPMLQNRTVKTEAVPDDVKNSSFWTVLMIHRLLQPRLLAQILSPIIVLAGAISIYQYMSMTKPGAVSREPQKFIFPVRSLSVTFTNDQPAIKLYGTTVAGRQVDLRALVAGKVIRTGSQLLAGGEVKTGDMLLEIESFDYEIAVSEAQAQLTEANAKIVEMEALLQVEKGNLMSAGEQLRLAQIDLDRAKMLVTRGTISKRTVDDRKLTLSQRRQVVQQLNNNLKVWSARKVQQKATISRLEALLKRARKRLSETFLTSPFNAYVSDVEAQIGRMMSVNDRVATLIDRDWIDVKFAITDRQFGRLTAGEVDLIGRPIVVTWDIGSRKLRYNATVERIEARVHAQDGGINIYGRIKTPQIPASIRPGVFVGVKIFDVQYKNVVKVPEEALYKYRNDRDEYNHNLSKDLNIAENEKHRKLYVINEGELEERRVQIVGASGQYFLVRGDLKPGERIMVTRLSNPGKGVLVKDLT